MAIRTISNSGGNYNSVGTWVEGVVPTSADDVVATATSGQLTVNVGSACKSIDFTNYTNTLTMNSILTVSGNVTLVAAMTITGSGTLLINAISTLTSNGKVWTGSVWFQGASVNKTFADSWTINGTFLINDSASTTTLNADLYVGHLTINNNTNLVNTLTGFKIYVSGNFTEGTTVVKFGTTEIVLNGTGTWSNSSTGALRLPLTINTSGTITIAGTNYYGTGTLRYISGNVITTGSTLVIQPCTLDTGGMAWNNVQLSGTTNTFTLLSDFNINGYFFFGTGQTMTFNTYNINVKGNINGGNGNITGTAILNYIGNGGVWYGVGEIRTFFNINTTGTLFINGTVGYSTRTLRHINGNVMGNTIFNSSSLQIIRNRHALTMSTSATILNISKFKFSSITISNGSTLNLNQFPSGTPDIKCNIQSTVVNGAVGINFITPEQRKAYNVSIRNIFVLAGKLNVINRDGNRGFNTGVIFGESGINGFPVNQFPIEQNYPMSSGFNNNMIQ